MLLMPRCVICRHFHHRVVPPITCDAFEGGIPDEFIQGDNDHSEPYPGDNGIRFEPIDEEKEGEQHEGGGEKPRPRGLPPKP